MTNAKVVRYHSDEGQTTGILFGAGRKYLQLILMDGRGIRFARNVENAEERYMTEAEYKGKAYPVKRAARHLLKAAKKFGGNTNAKKALREVA